MSEEMTRREREDLAKLVRRRERLAKATTVARAAELRADFEEQLATEYDPLDAMWREAYEDAERRVQELNAQIAERCQEAGIPARFAPSAHMGWLSRGENYSAKRRTELRKVAETRIAASEKAAKAEIERRSVDVQTALIAGGLESDEARTFLESIPSAAGLMPQLSVAAIEAATRGASEDVAA